MAIETVVAWNQRAEPPVGSLIYQDRDGNWQQFRPTEREGKYLGDNRVEILRSET